MTMAAFSLLFDASLQAGLTGLVLLALAALMRDRFRALSNGLVIIAFVKFAIPPIFALPTGIFSSLAIRTRSTAAEPSQGMRIVLAIYLCGACIVAMRRLAELFALRRIAREAKLPSAASRAALAHAVSGWPFDRVPELRVNAHIAAPCTTGIRTPMILLPATLEQRLTESEIRAVLIHELTHIQHHDVLRNTISAFLGVIWWFHPVFHLVDRRARAQREEHCDRAVVDAGVPADEYATTLVAVAALQTRRPVLAPGIGASGHPLRRRIQLLGATVLRETLQHRIATTIVLVTATLLLLPGASSSRTTIALPYSAHHVHNHHH